MQANCNFERFILFLSSQRYKMILNASRRQKCYEFSVTFITNIIHLEYLTSLLAMT